MTIQILAPNQFTVNIYSKNKVGTLIIKAKVLFIIFHLVFIK